MTFYRQASLQCRRGACVLLSPTASKESVLVHEYGHAVFDIAAALDESENEKVGSMRSDLVAQAQSASRAPMRSRICTNTG